MPARSLSLLRSKKSVSFEETTVVSTIDTQDKIDHSLWYHEVELQEIHRTELRLAQGILDDDDDDDSIACWRGLESYQEGLEHCRHRRHNFVQALLNVQAELRGMNINDPKGLQMFAAAHSNKDCRLARKRGKQDEAYVKLLLDHNKPVTEKQMMPVTRLSEEPGVARFLPQQMDFLISARSA